MFESSAFHQKYIVGSNNFDNQLSLSLHAFKRIRIFFWSKPLKNLQEIVNYMFDNFCIFTLLVSHRCDEFVVILALFFL